MTENEARQKWCPMVRFHMDRGGYVYDNKPILPENPNGEAVEKSPLCIASDCMMWLEIKEPRLNAVGQELDGQKMVGGYCGLAGKPE